MYSQRIVVTGGAGYIGSHFCKYAKSKGHQIFTIDNLSTGYKEFVKWGDFFLLDVRESNKLYKIIALGALKYHILKVDPKKKILFNPDESIEFNGNTGPFIQYTYARIKSILNKSDNISNEYNDLKLNVKEKELIILLCEFKNTVNNSIKALNPSLIANHIYELVKLYNSYYQTYTILGDKKINSFRVFLSEKVAIQIEKSMSLLGISVPNRM